MSLTAIQSDEKRSLGVYRVHDNVGSFPWNIYTLLEARTVGEKEAVGTAVLESTVITAS
jgi:hypothetical protein